MKLAKLLSALVMSLSVMSGASAAVINSADVSGLKTFKDTSTGRIWLDMNNFFDVTSNNSVTGLQMISTAQAAGFTFAAKADVTQLLGSLPLGPGQWAGYAPVMGHGVPRQLIWGMYDDGNNNGLYGWAYAFASYTAWGYADDVANPSVIQNQGNPNSQDLGLFAFIEGGSDVPEPTSIALIGLGLAGLLAARRRKMLA